MEGMGLKFTPVKGGRRLRYSSMFGPMAGTSGTHDDSGPESHRESLNIHACTHTL